MADTPNNATTKATFQGFPLTFATVSGSLEKFGDVDWIRIELVAGQTYRFFSSVQTQGFNGDSLLKLYNSSGALLDEDDDSGVGQNSILTFTPTSSGTFFISISDVLSYPGSYTIGVTANQAYTDVLASELDDNRTAASATDRAVGGRGNDRFTNYRQALGEQGDDLLSGSSLGDTLSGGLGNDAIIGNDGEDFLFGDAGSDIIDGGNHADVILGGDGNDALRGDGGADVLYGGADGDVLSGGADSDALYGDEGDDRIEGEAGADTLVGGTGIDTMIGGEGDDTYFVDNVKDQVVEVGAGSDTVRSTVSFRLGYLVENLELIGNAVTATGNGLANNIVGNDANNILAGGAGNDTLQGGGGKDGFLFNTALRANNVDHIVDFEPGDRIRLESDFFATLSPGGLPASAFKDIASGTIDENDRIIYNSGNGNLWYDANGSLAGGRIQFAVLDNHALLTRLDFLIV